jgi:hypothetical protein
MYVCVYIYIYMCVCVCVIIFNERLKIQNSATLTYSNYEGESNENLKSAIKIQNTAQLSCKLITVILMV